jgi:hypothetical protein
VSSLEQAVLDHVDVRLRRRRGETFELRVQIRRVTERTVVQVALYDRGAGLACVSLAPAELDDVIRALSECRRLTLGAPTESSAAADVKALAKAARRSRG